VVVLLYHDLSNDRQNSATMPPKLFRQHMAVLEKDFNVISLDDAVAFQNGTRPVPPNAVAITFDDGYRSNYDVAYPILRDYGWPATIFLTVNDVGRVNTSLEWLTWEQITEMAANSISFGSHSLTHGRIGDHGELVTRYPGEIMKHYQSRVADNLNSSYQILKDHGLTTLHFAAPFGEFNQTVRDSAFQAGFRYFWGVGNYPVMNGYRSLCRVDVGAHWTSPGKLRRMIIETARRTPPH
jgi:peptidoglycan/xylan/chitin deacetylase (PgdA/CDA1 family)